MSTGHKLSTEEEERTEILLDHIAKNTILGIDDKLHDDVTGPTVTAMKSGFYYNNIKKHEKGFTIEALLLLDIINIK